MSRSEDQFPEFDATKHPKPWKAVFDCSNDGDVWLEIVDANHETVMSYTDRSQRSYEFLQYLVAAVNAT